MRWSEWKPLLTGIPPGQSENAGLIPDDLLPTTAIQLRYYIHLEESLASQPGGIGFLTWEGRWQWRILNGGVPLFDQTVRVSFDLVYLKPFGVSGVTFFTWWFNDAAHRIETVTPQPCYLSTGYQGGTPQAALGSLAFSGPSAAVWTPGADAIAPVPVVLHPTSIGPSDVTVNANLKAIDGSTDAVSATVGANATADVRIGSGNYVGVAGTPSPAGGRSGDVIDVRSEGWVHVAREKGFADPAGYPPGTATTEDLPSESGFTDDGVWIDLWYYNPAYTLSVPEESYVDIPFHNIGNVNWAKSFQSVFVRTGEAGGVDSIVDRPGFHRAAVPNATRCAQLISGDGGKTYTTRRIVGANQLPSIVKSPENHLFVATYAKQKYRILVSENDGRTWANLTHYGGIAMVDGIWPDTYSDMTTRITTAGVLVSIARSGTTLYCKTSADGFNNRKRVGVVSQDPWSLAYDAGQDRLIATDGKTAVFVSKDAGRSWATLTAAGLA